jgi:hypothetical protein
MDRRNFLKSVLAAATLFPLRGMSSGSDVPRRLLGRTGEKVSIVGIGGYHLGLPQVTEAESIRIVRTAIDGGITFLDNCWDYNGGISEIRMGKALRNGYRERVFLMTKLDGRNASAAAQQLDDSLRRLQTDRMDLIQFHEVIRYTDPSRIFCAWWGDGSDVQGETGRQSALRRIHRPQESRDSSGNVKDRLRSRLYF